VTPKALTIPLNAFAISDQANAFSQNSHDPTTSTPLKLVAIIVLTWNQLIQLIKSTRKLILNIKTYLCSD